jgi:putative hydrolase of the HAD superfamily
MNEHARVEQIERAVEIRMRYIGWALQPRADAVSTLARLKTEGFKLGLISNASIEIPMVWQETPFAGLIDEPIFSSQAHLKKPDVSIYHLACKRLALSAESCLYVGDGEDHELSAAATVGLHPVLIRSSSTQSMSRLHQEAKEWQGATITRLPEILQLV